MRLQPASGRCLFQSSERHGAIRERRQGHELCWTGNVFEQVMCRTDDRSCDELGERSVVATVRSAQRVEVFGAVRLVNDCRRASETHENEIHRQSAGSTIAVDERVYPLKPSVKFRQCERDLVGENRSSKRGVAEGSHGTDPEIHFAGNEYMVRGGHATVETINIVKAEPRRLFTRNCVGMRIDCPHVFHRQIVGFANFLHRDEFVCAGIAMFVSVLVHPGRCPRVPEDLEVLLVLLCSDDRAGVEQRGDFLQHERVAFDGGELVELTLA